MSSGYFGQSAQMDHRQLGSELGTISSTSGPILDTERQAAKDMGKDQLGLSQDWAKSALQLYPQITGAERGATSLQRVQDWRDLGGMGPGMVRSLNKINPGWQGSLNELNSESKTAGMASPLLGDLNSAAGQGLDEARGIGPSDLRTQLQGQASSDLAAGSELTPEQLRDVQQSVRAAYGDRGTSDSNPAMFAEALGRDQYAQQRLAARRQFAGQVQQMGQGEDASNTARQVQLGQFANQVEGANQAQVGQRQNILSNAVGVNQQALQPVLGMFGRTGVAPNAGGQIMSSAPNIIGAGQGAVNPLLTYGSDLFNTNFNSDAATRISNANNMAAIHGAIIGAVGNLAGGAIKCWVAREVYGLEIEPKSQQLKWVIVRDWMSTHAPQRVHDLYVRHGRAFAALIRTRPRLKRLTRWLFDRILCRELQLQAECKRRHWNYVKYC